MATGELALSVEYWQIRIQICGSERLLPYKYRLRMSTDRVAARLNATSQPATMHVLHGIFNHHATRTTYFKNA
ncbi:hypothetical protein KIN20_026098 [Parelaphostrongylus tenuis]|uniref:Uncharacterized protein n=1 Tax=Parelaphostrongylus tenuis TaxID=148309 RepID=A0AAD5N058_PARTN|nr:hypothetical protein KIN20_026098 [Parelaphostrongylus tenuis]